jgi:hypothetical protein
MGQTATEHFRKAYADPSLRVWWDDMDPGRPGKLVEEQIKTDMD